MKQDFLTKSFSLPTVQATGIAALHTCFMRGNPPYCMQSPWEKHAWNTRVKIYTQNLRVLGLNEFLHCYNQLQKYLRHCTVFWLKWPVHHLVLLTPLHPLSKLPAIQDHAQNLEEQLWMGGRREVSISPHRPVTSNDLKQERLCFCECLSTFFQLVVWVLHTSLAVMPDY